MSRKKFAVRWVFRGILTGGGLALVLSFFIFQNLVNCWLIPHNRHFVLLEPGVYVSRGMPRSLYSSVEEVLEDAHRQASLLWGALEAPVVMILCATDEEFSQFGKDLGTPALVHLGPGTSYIIVKPDGVSADVIGHELSHAELKTRLGWWYRMQSIPAWFDEGLAVLLDGRFVEEPLGQLKSVEFSETLTMTTLDSLFPLENLQKIKQFYKEDQLYTYLAYVRSGQEVSRWFTLVGKSGLEELIARLKTGEAFDQAYQGVMDRYLSLQNQKLPEIP